MATPVSFRVNRGEINLLYIVVPHNSRVEVMEEFAVISTHTFPLSCLTPRHNSIGIKTHEGRRLEVWSPYWCFTESVLKQLFAGGGLPSTSKKNYTDRCTLCRIVNPNTLAWETFHHLFFLWTTTKILLRNLKGIFPRKLTGVLIYIKRYKFVCCIAGEILYFYSKGQPPLNSIKPFSAFNYQKN